MKVTKQKSYEEIGDGDKDGCWMVFVRQENILIGLLLENRWVGPTVLPMVGRRVPRT